MGAQLLKGVQHQAYHKDELPGSPRFSRTAAVKILQSPLLCYSYHPALGNAGEVEDDDETEELRSGSLYHELLLGGGLGLAVCDVDSFRSNDAKKQKAEAVRNGLVPITRVKYEAALVHARHMRKRLEEEGFVLAEFETEVTALWEEDDIACKSRLDGLKLAAGHIIDLKCVKSISRRSFENRIPIDGLDIQAHTQIGAVEKAHPAIAGRIQHDFLVCQYVPPYDAMVVSLAPAKLSLGASRWRRALARWRECRASGRWPGVGRVPSIDAKPWELEDELTAATSAGMSDSLDPAWMKGAC